MQPLQTFLRSFRWILLIGNSFSLYIFLNSTVKIISLANIHALGKAIVEAQRFELIVELIALGFSNLANNWRVFKFKLKFVLSLSYLQWILRPTLLLAKITLHEWFIIPQLSFNRHAEKLLNRIPFLFARFQIILLSNSDLLFILFI